MTDASRDWPSSARRLYDSHAISKALDEQAKRLASQVAEGEEVTLMALMNGGLMPAAELAKRLCFPFRFDYLHATRYREARVGQDLHWIRKPSKVSGTVIVVDDIFDEGYTMAAVKEALEEAGADRVLTIVAVRKQHERGLPRDWVDDFALEVPDEYVFGFGMDLDGLWRQLDSIWSVS